MLQNQAIEGGSAVVVGRCCLGADFCMKKKL